MAAKFVVDNEDDGAVAVAALEQFSMTMQTSLLCGFRFSPHSTSGRVAIVRENSRKILHSTDRVRNPSDPHKGPIQELHSPTMYVGSVGKAEEDDDGEAKGDGNGDDDEAKAVVMVVARRRSAR